MSPDDHRHREEEHHHQMAEVLVVHDDVHRHRERREQHVVDELDPEQKLQVDIELVAVVAAERLEQHAGAHEHRLQRDEHRDEREESAEHRHPIRHRRDGREVPHADVALAPHELPGEDRDEQRHHRGRVRCSAPYRQ